MIPRRLIALYRQFIPVIRFNDLISIDRDGFWFPRSYQRRSLLRAAREFQSIQGQLIVEIGSGIHGAMSGNSILVWARKTNAKRILAVDLDPLRIEEVRMATRRYPHVETLLADGRDVVKSINTSVDLLYLDFWIEDSPNTKLIGQARAESYLEIYRCAREKMAKTSLILIDDTDHIDPWKQSLIISEARIDGFQVLYVGRQTLLRRD